MDQVSSHFSAVTGTRTADIDDASETSNVTIQNEGDGITYEEIYGMDEQAAKGEPIRGRKYMLFTMIAMLILTIIVGMNANIQALEKIRDQKLQHQVSGIERQKEPTKPAESTTTKTTEPKEEPKPEEKPKEPETTNTDTQKTTETTKESSESTANTETKPAEGGDAEKK